MTLASFAAAAALVVLFAPSLARADVPPPNAEGCNGKAAGDTCEMASGASGRCAATRCNRLDYSQRDGGPPGTVEYDCVLCSSADAGPEGSSQATSGCTSTGSPAPYGALAVGALVLGLAALKRRG